MSFLICDPNKPESTYFLGGFILFWSASCPQRSCFFMSERRGCPSSVTVRHPSIHPSAPGPSDVWDEWGHESLLIHLFNHLPSPHCTGSRCFREFNRTGEWCSFSMLTSPTGPVIMMHGSADDWDLMWISSAVISLRTALGEGQCLRPKCLIQKGNLAFRLIFNLQHYCLARKIDFQAFSVHLIDLLFDV